MCLCVCEIFSDRIHKLFCASSFITLISCFPFRLTIFLLNKVRFVVGKHDGDFIEWHFNWHLSTSNCKNKHQNGKKSETKNLNDLKGKCEFIFGNSKGIWLDAFVKTIFFTHIQCFDHNFFTGSLKKCDVQFRRLPSHKFYAVCCIYYIFLEFRSREKNTPKKMLWNRKSIMLA